WEQAYNLGGPHGPATFFLCNYPACETAGQYGYNRIGARQLGKPVEAILRPAIFDRDVLALGIAGVFQALAKCAQRVLVRARRSAIEQPDHWHRGLLRARRERPRRGRAAEKRDERAAAPHSITSSARASSVGGTARPSILAASALIPTPTVVDTPPSGSQRSSLRLRVSNR